MKKRYDVFISYRRSGGGKEIARILDAEIDKSRYNSFLDFNELKDSAFGPQIMEAIDSAPVFLFILSQGALDRCVNEDDWVRKEIMYALSKGKHIVPVNPDGLFKEFPEGVPQEIVSALGDNQQSDLMLGQLFKDSVKKLIKERIRPYVPRVRWVRRIVAALCIIAAECIGSLVMDYVNSGKAVQDDYNQYVEYIDQARGMMADHDSSSVVVELLNKAESVASRYSGTESAGMFGNRPADIKDSLFVVYSKQFEFYYNRYIDFGCVETSDKQKALQYIDKALEIKSDDYLETMKNVLM